MVLTFRYRLLPTKRQHRALEAILESQRELYNAALQERIDAFRKAKVNRSHFDQLKALTEWRRSDEEARSLALNVQRATLNRLDNAYRGFFRRIKRGEKAGLPRFQGKERFNSFGFREFRGISLKGGRIRFSGMPGSIRVYLHREMPRDGTIKSCSFRRDLQGWNIGLNYEFALPTASQAPSAGAVGIDLGITTFVTLSDGKVIPSLRAARRAERRLRIAQRNLSRKVRGSRSRQKALRVVRHCHAATARRRSNFLHQASAQIARGYEMVVVEGLNLRGLTRGTLSKDVHDASWGRFISMLRYKAACAGTRLIEVDPRNTSQDCSGCGARVEKGRGELQHTCPSCGLSIGRDLNAARNVLIRAGVGPGLHNVAGYGKRASGNLNETSGPGYVTGRNFETLPISIASAGTGPLP